MRIYSPGRLLSLLLLAAVSTAQADDDDSYPWYGGFAIGFAGSDEDCDYYSYDCDGNDTGFKFFGGKRLHENLAFEIAFYDLGKIDNELGSVTTTAESTGVNLSLLGIIPIGEAGYFYGKVGAITSQNDYQRIEATTTRSDDDGTDFSFGAGFAYTFDKKYDLRLEFERLNELSDDFTPGGSYITVFSFGGTIYFE